VKPFDPKENYGDEYPAAVVCHGIRMTLRRESRFSRSYYSDEHKTGCEESRFNDGSASITALELEQDWDKWTEDMRTDFCHSCGLLELQADFPEMLRFIMEHGGPEQWAGIASSVARLLPRDEAFDTLVRALHNAELGPSAANIAQAIAHTKHPDAEVTLRRHLAALWEHPALWDGADFINWVAYAAMTCIAHLIELGAPPSDFSEQARRLSEHVCSRNRESCRKRLSKHYSWLKGDKSQ
jgi:hypothetical protein